MEDEDDKDVLYEDPKERHDRFLSELAEEDEGDAEDSEGEDEVVMCCKDPNDPDKLCLCLECIDSIIDRAIENRRKDAN